MAISEACQFEIRDEVNGMVEKGEAGTKTEAFRKMVEFYAAIGIEIKEKTVERKYFRAQKLTNVSNEENQEETDTSAKLEKLEKKQHGGSREGAGRKPTQETHRVHAVDKETRSYMQDVDTVSEEFRAAFDGMVAAIYNAKEGGWDSTTKVAALKMVDSLQAIIS